MSEPADQRGTAADAPEPDAKPSVSGAAASSAGVGSGPGARPATAGDVEGPEKPELYLAAAFAGAFLFARILKRIAE